MSHLRILLQIAARNIFATRMNVIVGFIMLLGTMLVVIGTSFIDSIDRAMTSSIQNSVAGQIQVYSSKSKDELALFGGFGGESNLAPILDYAKMRDALQTVPNVDKVVPMGVRGAMLTTGNIIDVTLSRLRQAYKAKETGTDIRQEPGETRASIDVQIRSLRDHVRQMVTVLQADQSRLAAIRDAKASNEEETAAIQKASSEEFWASFDADPYEHLEFLENRVAPMMADGDPAYLLYVGTDFDSFENAFDRMEVVEGQKVPPGQRGFLISKFVMEDQFKLKTARRMDLLKEGLDLKHKTIATDAELQRFVKENTRQTRELLLQLDRLKSDEMAKRLRAFLKTDETDLQKLLQTFFQTDDQNFEARYQFFYAEMAPMLQLYRVKIGDTLTITAFTSSGYVQSVNVPIYGAVQFKGLEKSAVSGALNLMDLMSFRDLYGYLTPEKKAELEKLKAAAGAKDVKRENAEAELFGGGGDVVEAEATPGLINDQEHIGEGFAAQLKRDDLLKRVYNRDEIEHGMVLNAAVLLKDPSKVRETIAAINKLSEEKGLNIKAVSWQEASGLIGQLVLVAKVALYLAILIFFVIALVVVNNAMMMATLQRVREIGTMRAIGAQRPFVLSMVLLETVALGLFFGAVGALLGWGVVQIAHWRGIPATSDELYFFFSGPRLRPVTTAGNIILAFVAVLFVSAISTFYPAFIATRVSPVKAMQTDE